jgi:hypothetical protein
MSLMSLLPPLLLIGPGAWAQGEVVPRGELKADPVPEAIDHVDAPAGTPGGDEDVGKHEVVPTPPDAAAPPQFSTPSGEPAVAGTLRNFLVAVDDEGGTYAGQTLTFTIGEGANQVTVRLADDGEPPDVEAGDGRSAAAIIGYSGPTAPATLHLADGTALWSDPAFTVAADLAQPSLRLTVGAEGVTGGLGVDGAAVGPDALSPTDPGLKPTGPPTAVPVDGTKAPLRRGRGLVAPIVLGMLGGCLVGFGVGELRRRRRDDADTDSALAPRVAVAWPPGLAQPEPGVGACWLLPDEQARTDLLVGLARHCASAGPVLVAPGAATRGALATALAGLPTVLVPAGDGVSAVGLAAAAKTLGEGVVLVEGPSAIEPPDEGEDEDAPVDELIELSPLPVLLLVLAGEATPVQPAIAFTRSSEGLLLGERRVLDGQRLVLSSD